MEKELTETEKQQAIEDFEAKQNRRYKRGKALVFVIAGINIIFAISSVILNFNLIKHSDRFIHCALLRDYLS